MIRKTKGIVLHTTRYGESSLIIHCYTEQLGRQSYMVKGVRKSRKQNRPNLFQPLCILDFEVYHKDGREIQLVKEVSRSLPLNSIPHDIMKSSQAIFMAEILYRVVKEEEQNLMLSRFLLSTIELLDALNEPSPDFHIAFLFQLTRYLGFYPRPDYGRLHRFFNLEDGHFQDLYAEGTVLLDETDSKLWRQFMNIDFLQSDRNQFNGEQRKTVIENLIRYYMLHVEGMGEIRSLDVLHELFHN